MKSATAALVLSLSAMTAWTPSSAWAAVGVAKAHKAQPAAEQAPPAQPTSALGLELAAWVLANGDNNGLPFAVIDKVAAEVLVYGADGEFRGFGPALVGSAIGDDSTPGVGDRELSDIAPADRTTPAGRFVAGYGPALGHRKVLWVDYGTAISMHAVVTANRKEKRLKRLATPTPEDNRITFGCINVSAAFYENVVRKSFTGTEGIVYILPETRTLAEVFPAFAREASAMALAPRENKDQDLARTPDVSESVVTGTVDASEAPHADAVITLAEPSSARESSGVVAPTEADARARRAAAFRSIESFIADGADPVSTAP